MTVACGSEHPDIARVIRDSDKGTLQQRLVYSARLGDEGYVREVVLMIHVQHNTYIRSLKCE